MTVAIAEQVYYVAKIKADFPTKFDGKSALDVAYVEEPVVSHVWGYKPVFKKGQRVYFLRLKAESFEMEGKQYDYAEHWLVINEHNQALSINTTAAKKYLKAERDEQGKTVQDESGAAKRTHERILWELSR